MIEKLTRLCNDHKLMCEFVSMNVTAIRKILKKFDKKMEDYSLPMTQKYLESRMIEDENSPDA